MDMNTHKEQIPQSKENQHQHQHASIDGHDMSRSSTTTSTSTNSSAGQNQKKRPRHDELNDPQDIAHATPSSTCSSSKKSNTQTDADTGASKAGTGAGADAGEKTITANDAATSSSATSSSNAKSSPCMIDIAQTLNLQPGQRIEVRWDLHFDEPAQVQELPDIGTHHVGGGTETEGKPPLTQTRTQTRWWGGTLLHPDGRMHILQDQDPSSKDEDIVQVPVRVIDYDPYIEGGFPDRSLEDVCFLTDHSLYNMASDSRMWWRKHGDAWMPGEDMEEEERKLMTNTDMNTNATSNANQTTSDDEISVTSTSREDALRVVLDSVLQGALLKAGIDKRMNQLDPSQQSFMAEKIAKAKEKLTENLMEQLNNNNNTDDDKNGNDSSATRSLEQVVTKEHIQKCMEDLKGLK